MDTKKQLEEIRQRVGQYRLGEVTQTDEGCFESGKFSPVSFGLANYACSFGEVQAFVRFLNFRLNSFGLETRVTVASDLVPGRLGGANTARFGLTYPRDSSLLEKREHTDKVLQKIPAALDDYMMRK